MNIIQTVVIKHVLTEASKEKLLHKFVRAKLQLEKEIEQLRFEMKKLEKTKKFPLSSIKDKFEKEMNIRKEKIKELDFQTEQLHILPIGSELKEKEIQGIVEINVGDNWEELTEKTIIIKDGIVTEIR